jgi:hypothetical protein
MLRSWNLLPITLLLLAGCGETPNETSKLEVSPKDALKARARLTLLKEGTNDHHIKWHLPSEWEERQTEGMASSMFLSRSPRDQPVEISMTLLKGKVASDLSNINRWRRQLMVNSWNEQEMSEASRAVQTPMGKARLISFQGTHDTSNSGVTAAILPVNQGTWFIKMTGTPQAIKEQNRPFFQFLTSLSPTATTETDSNPQ